MRKHCSGCSGICKHSFTPDKFCFAARRPISSATRSVATENPHVSFQDNAVNHVLNRTTGNGPARRPEIFFKSTLPAGVAGIRINRWI